MCKATNITRHEGHVAREARYRVLGQQGCTIWLTGLPSSGKSTTAFTLEHELLRRGFLAYVLDGDNVRLGLNRNLGFSAADRQENIRRIGEVAKLFADAGAITIASFISPYRQDREVVREMHRAAGLDFVEVYVNAPLSVCEQHDPKGLYRRARAGEIKGFTGVDDPYERPEAPDIELLTDQQRPGALVATLFDFLVERGVVAGTTRSAAAIPLDEPAGP